MQSILKDIQGVLRLGTTNRSEEIKQKKKGDSLLTLEDIITKYITNDDVGGG